MYSRKSLLATANLVIIAALTFSMLLASHPAAASPDAPLSVYLTEGINATIIADTFATSLSSWNVTGNLTVANLAGEVVFDIYVAVYQNSTLLPTGSSTYQWSTVELPSYLSRVYAYVQGVNDTGLPQYVLDKVPPQAGYTYIVFHITSLQPGDRVVLKYVITDLKGLRFPLEFSEKVSPDKILDGVETTMEVNISVKNVYSGDLQVRFRKTLPADNGKEGWMNVTGNPVFNSSGTASIGSTSLDAANKTLYWTGDGSWPGTWITLASGSTASLQGVQVNGTPDVSEVGGVTTKIGLGVLEVFLQASTPITGTTLGRVQAVAESSVNVEKSQEPTAPATEWNETLTFCDKSSTFKVELYNVTLWATGSANPSATPITGSVHSQYSAPTPIAVLLPGACYTYGPFEFTATVVPWVWGSAAPGIARDEAAGWWLYNATVSSVDSSGRSRLQLVETVWAVKGYLLKVVKEVRNSTSGVQVTVTLYNIGGSESPYVSMYDLIPTGFDATAAEASMSFTPYGALAVDNGAAGPTPPDFSEKVTNPLSGYQAGYVWDVYPVPGPEMGFNAWVNASAPVTVQVRLRDGSTRIWTVQGVDASTVLINGTSYAEGSSFTVASGTPAETNFTVAWVEDTIDAAHNGHVLVSAKTYYPDAGVYTYNPVAVHYAAPGTGNYNASKVFIVGVDPRHVLSAPAVFEPNTSVQARLWSDEPLLALIAAASLAFAALVPVGRRDDKDTGDW